MIQRIIEFSINNKTLIAIFTLAIVVGGIWSAFKVPIDAVPDITNNQVQIITQAPNLSTEDIEQFVTYQVELAVANLPGVIEIRSISRFGLSAVTVVFEDDMGTYLPRQLVNEKLDQIKDNIPENFGTPFMGPITTGLGEILQYTLEVDSTYKGRYSLYELRSIQDWIIRRQMAMVPGVNEVNTFGGAIKQYEVAIDPHRLNAMNLTMDEVYQAIKRNNQNTGGAYIEYDHRANFIRGEGLIKNLQDIEKVVIKINDNTPVTIRDVASVGFGNGVRYGAFTMDAEGEAVGGIILMLKGENSNEVIQNVKDRIAAIQNSLPPGIAIEPFLDRSELISKTTSTVRENLMGGALIVIFVLVFLLGNWRGGLIVASTIPLSLLFAFIMMNMFDVWANLMSLGAIDFGIIVDGAVIIVEGSVFLLHKKLVGSESIDGKVRDETAAKSSKQMMNSAFFGQLVILIVFLPILALEGIEGKMFQPMALTFMFAMIGVMILCLTYIPMMSAWFLRPGSTKPGWGDRFVHWLERYYDYALRKTFRYGVLVVIGALSLFGLAYTTFNQLGGEFIPRLDEGDIAFHDLLKPGSSLEDAVKITTKVEEALLNEFPEINHVLSRIGVSDVPIDLMPMDAADCFIKLKPRDQWVSAETKPELIEKIKAHLLEIPGVNYEFTQPIEMRFNELMTGIRQDVAVKIFGEDLDILADKAEDVATLIGGIKGVGDLRIEATEGQPQISIQYDRNKLAFYGITIQELNMLVETAFAGRKAGVVFEGERRYDLVMRLEQDYRSSLEDVQLLLVNLPSGNQVPLKELATIDYQPGPMQISRDNTNRRTYVGINVRGRDVKSLIEEIGQVLDKNLDLPPGYYVRYGGAFENLQRATRRLRLVVPIALGMIFLLVFLALRSFKQTVMIYMAIPLSAIGGVFSLWIRDMPFSISAGIGFIVLFGIAVLNGLVLINGWNELKQEASLSLQDRIVQGAKRRIRPILLTASTDILGFMPMAISTSSGAEVQRPLATVVIGGMITATLLTLFLLPVLYRWIESNNPVSTKPVAALLILIFGIFSGPTIMAQNEIRDEVPIGMEEAIGRALSGYPSIKAAGLEVEKQQKLKKTAWDFGQSGLYNAGDELGAEGQGVSTIVGFQHQNLDIFSGFAKSRAQQSKIRYASTREELTSRQLTREVKMAYGKAYIALRQMILFGQIDSLYRSFEEAVKLKLEVDESSRLEFLAAANQARQVAVQKQQADYDYEIALRNLNRWLVSDTLFTVDTIQNLWLQPLSTTGSSINGHPQLQLARDGLLVSQQNISRQKAGYLPKINFQYGVQAIDGMRGFYQYQAGMLFPLIFNKQQGMVEAARVQQDIAAQQLKQTTIELENNLSVSRANYEKWLNSWQFYKQEALPLAEEQLDGSKLAFKEGSIDYVTFLMNTHNALKTQLEALEAMDSFLKSKFNLEYLINN